MKKVLIIGCPGAGKSTFARKLAAKTGLPLLYLDMIWHRRDGTNIGRTALLDRLETIAVEEEWILDGNYLASLPFRLSRCDTVFYFDIPVEICLAGAIERLGKPRVDMPWSADELDEEFREWILSFPTDQAPEIESLLRSFHGKVVRFKTRKEADAYIEGLKHSSHSER